ncbi:MAG: hypothetical protein ACYCSN_09960 [Acidobacteriaceae bacterium]
MRSILLAATLLSSLHPHLYAAPPAAPNPLADISVYNGAWTVTAQHTMAGPGKQDHLVNRCRLTGSFYACEQVVNGKTMALILFVAGDKPGQFHTQSVLPDGHSVGRGDLVIVHETKGDHWTFTSKDTEQQKTKQYRTENYFSGPNKIHFDQFESIDGVKWELKNSGDEQRSTY